MGVAFALIGAIIAVAIAASSKKGQQASAPAPRDQPAYVPPPSQPAPRPGNGGNGKKPLPPEVQQAIKDMKSGAATPDQVEKAAQVADRAGMPDVAAKLRELNQPPTPVTQALADLQAGKATVEELNAAADAADAAHFTASANILRTAARLMAQAQQTPTAPSGIPYGGPAVPPPNDPIWQTPAAPPGGAALQSGSISASTDPGENRPSVDVHPIAGGNVAIDDGGRYTDGRREG